MSTILSNFKLTIDFSDDLTIWLNEKLYADLSNKDLDYLKRELWETEIVDTRKLEAMLLEISREEIKSCFSDIFKTSSINLPRAKIVDSYSGSFVIDFAIEALGAFYSLGKDQKEVKAIKSRLPYLKRSIRSSFHLSASRYFKLAVENHYQFKVPEDFEHAQVILDMDTEHIDNLVQLSKNNHRYNNFSFWSLLLVLIATVSISTLFSYLFHKDSGFYHRDLLNQDAKIDSLRMELEMLRSTFEEFKLNDSSNAQVIKKQDKFIKDFIEKNLSDTSK